LGDERLLREFFVGDMKAKELSDSGSNAILYLINDSYDALNERQLRIALNKDERLIEKFKPYCGRPIAEIPDPYGCCASYA
jgi:lysyl-tRNA synthetase class I